MFLNQAWAESWQEKEEKAVGFHWWEKLSWAICHSPDHLWQVTRSAEVSCGSHDLGNDESGAAVDSWVLSQLQKVVSCSAPAQWIDAACRGDFKPCFILGERGCFAWQCVFLTASSFHLAVGYNFWAQCVCYFLFGFVYIILICVIDSDCYPSFVFQHFNEKQEGRGNQNIFGLVPSI